MKSRKNKGEKAKGKARGLGFEVGQGMNSKFWQPLLYDIGQTVSLTSLVSTFEPVNLVITHTHEHGCKGYLHVREQQPLWFLSLFLVFKLHLGYAMGVCFGK